jgi:hypothetical protein
MKRFIERKTCLSCKEDKIKILDFSGKRQVCRTCVKANLKKEEMKKQKSLKNAHKDIYFGSGSHKRYQFDVDT